ncbi:MAG: DUF126 domain-containing protein [Pseudoclavibacter sp.]|jgi:predicted aconitase with swiveling domain
MSEFNCHKISEGRGEGELLVTSDDMCFYLVDPPTGKVIEDGHELYGTSIAGKVLVFPNGKGSSVVQADGLFQLQKAGNAPKALVIQNPDTTLVASAIILEIPMVDRVDAAFYEHARSGMPAVVDADTGSIAVEAASVPAGRSFR